MRFWGKSVCLFTAFVLLQTTIEAGVFSYRIEMAAREDANKMQRELQNDAQRATWATRQVMSSLGYEAFASR